MVLTRSQRRKRDEELKKKGNNSNNSDLSNNNNSNSSTRNTRSKGTNKSTPRYRKQSSTTASVKNSRVQVPISREDKDLDTEQVTSIQSPKPKIVNLPNNQFEQCFSQMNLFAPTYNTPRIYSCIVSVIISGFLIYFLNDCNELSIDYNNNDFIILAMLIFFMLIDILVNFIITFEFTLGNIFPDYGIELSCCSESIVHFFIILLTLQIFGIFENLNIFITLFIQIINIIFQIIFKESNYIRFICYLPILISIFVGFGHLGAMNTPIYWYCIICCVQMLVDGMDFPDYYYSKIAFCEAIVMILRAVGILILINERLLQIVSIAKKPPSKIPI